MGREEGREQEKERRASELSFMNSTFAISTRWQSKSNLGRTFSIVVSQVETAQNKEQGETVEGKVE